ncbi:MAG: nitrite/sulfite reductase [Anaerolineae bacterium]
MTTWKNILEDKMPDYLAEEIDTFEGQIILKQQNKLDDKVFAETRLRRGVYGQRYDNGQRDDGIRVQSLNFPSGDLLKGPETIWDAPGMVRIKVPFGGLSIEQMEVIAELADEYSDGILHVTTRQDFQYHYVHIEDTPDLMRRLAAVGITTREACGNTVRNVTACPLAGVCRDEAFDVTPYAKEVATFLLGHDDTQDFGRKFKTAFSGCEQHACGLVRMHDLGFLAQVKEINGEFKRGFKVFVGGGLGTIPYQAQVLAEFATEEEILPLSQAVARVFARLGEKKNRNRARIKFLVEQVGIEEFRRLVDEELKTLPQDERWTSYIAEIPAYAETPAKAAFSLNGEPLPQGFEAWYQTNVYPQRQPGYSTITVNLPLGDLTADQMFRLADIARQYVGDNVRTTVEQNIVLRWISNHDLPPVYQALKDIGLGEPGAGTIVDITSCPGTDTCKLGIASSRGLAGELRTRLAAKNASLPEAVKDLRIKISGCFNSCGQHHIADIGFFGNSRRAGNRKVPHFQLVLGGQWEENAGSFGMAIGAIPAKRVPEVLDVITQRYANERERGETFQSWIKRLGKQGVREMIDPYTALPVYEVEPELFSDWGDSRVYSISDIGVGECAGEVVSLFSIEISQAESEHFESLVALDDGKFAQADQSAYRSMLMAARALVRTRYPNVGQDADRIVEEFRQRFYDTELFFDKYARGKFAQYFFERHLHPSDTHTRESAYRIIEEARLFIEACHECEARLTASSGVSIL